MKRDSIEMQLIIYYQVYSFSGVEGYRISINNFSQVMWHLQTAAKNPQK